jgi:hypothetical protein
LFLRLYRLSDIEGVFGGSYCDAYAADLGAVVAVDVDDFD